MVPYHTKTKPPRKFKSYLVNCSDDAKVFKETLHVCKGPITSAFSQWLSRFSLFRA